jgi:hypothetical protein
MNDAVIIAVANAITAQAETLKALIDALPKETKIAVEKKVSKNTPVAASVETPAPVVVETPAPVVVQTTTALPTMPAAPFPTPAPVVAPAPIPAAPVMAAPAPVAPVAAVVSPSNVPFSDHQGLLKWVMNAYQSVPAEKGARIQEVLNGLGVRNINDIKPEQWGALVDGVNKLLSA